MSKHHGSLAASGSVSSRFQQKGRITIPRSLTGENRTLEPAIDPPDHPMAVTNEHPAARVLHLHEALDDHDDTRHVYPNSEAPEEILARASA